MFLKDMNIQEVKGIMGIKETRYNHIGNILRKITSADERASWDKW